MTRAEMGSGRGGMDTINLFSVTDCSDNCPLRGEGNGRFRCIKNNGSATIVVTGGITRGTIYELEQVAPCLEEDKQNP